jgi:hypothetical protein
MKVSHDMVEGAGRQARRQVEEIALHHRDAPGEIVERDVVAGEADEVALDLDAGDAAGGHPRRQAERGGADAAADIEDGVLRPGRHGGGEEDGIDGDAIAGRRLTQAQPAAEQPVLARRGRSRGRVLAHAIPASASRSTALARK